MLKESVDELSGRIIQIVQNWETEPVPMLATTLHKAINIQIEWYLNDVFAVLKNINETSLNNIDRAQRLIELEVRFGIPKTHTIIKS